MDIKLKGIKYHTSTDGYAYAGNLYVDGKKVLRVIQHGNGGCTDFEGDRDVIDKLEAYAATLPPTEYLGMTFNQSLETIADDLFDNHLQRKDVQTQMRKGVVFLQPDDIGKGTFSVVDYTGRDNCRR